MKKIMMQLLLPALALCLAPVCVFAGNEGGDAGIASIRLVQQYNFSIHILVMLLAGFGFIYVFMRNYGYGATTATYIVTAIGIPLYMLLRATGKISSEPLEVYSMKSLLLAEFAVASGLIAMGALLGRIRLHQYGIMALVFIPAYMINEWLVLDGGLGVTKGFVDTAGSVVLHAFGAYFGLGMSIMLSNEKHRNEPVTSDATSDRFSMLGSILLWIFWPSFCCALVSMDQFAQTAVNTIFALCGSTLVTVIASAMLRKGKVSIGDVANAALAGGVSIGATCNVVSGPQALLIGAVAGAICTVGFVFVQPLLLKKIKILDSAGVHNLHGMPGLFGGLAAVVAVPAAAKAELVGMVVTFVLAWIAGIICGLVLKATGTKKVLYEDSEDFLVS
jgi:ammonium transporter Rh